MLRGVTLCIELNTALNASEYFLKVFNRKGYVRTDERTNGVTSSLLELLIAAKNLSNVINKHSNKYLYQIYKTREKKMFLYNFPIFTDPPKKSFKKN